MEPKVNLALNAARKGSKELLRYADEVDKLDVIEKGPTDYVTELDKRVERLIINDLKKAYPKHSYLSEEVGLEEGKGTGVNSLWIIDPLDGTTNYIHGFPYYAITIAYVEKRKVLNENQLVKFLAKYKYVAVDCSNLSMEVTIKTFSQAKNIIIPHGAHRIQVR